MEQKISLSSMPGAMRWLTVPAGWDTDGVAGLRIQAGPKTDMFVDPFGSGSWLNAPWLVCSAPEGDFQLSARVDLDGNDTYDAGALAVWADEGRWAKLCLERSPDAENLVISVVTRRSSDDANCFVVDGSSIWLRVSRRGRGLAFHASHDGQHWIFVRQFDLGAETLQIGFGAQAPTGSGCAVRFDSISFAATTIGDLRDGS
jgi:uncharacterized protein